MGNSQSPSPYKPHQSSLELGYDAEGRYWGIGPGGKTYTAFTPPEEMDMSTAEAFGLQITVEELGQVGFAYTTDSGKGGESFLGCAAPDGNHVDEEEGKRRGGKIRRRRHGIKSILDETTDDMDDSPQNDQKYLDSSDDEFDSSDDDASDDDEDSDRIEADWSTSPVNYGKSLETCEIEVPKSFREQLHIPESASIIIKLPPVNPQKQGQGQGGARSRSNSISSASFPASFATSFSTSTSSSPPTSNATSPRSSRSSPSETTTSLEVDWSCFKSKAPSSPNSPSPFLPCGLTTTEITSCTPVQKTVNLR